MVAQHNIVFNILVDEQKFQIRESFTSICISVGLDWVVTDKLKTDVKKKKPCYTECNRISATFSIHINYVQELFSSLEIKQYLLLTP